MDREAWHAAIHGVAKSRTRLSDWTELNWVLWIGPRVVEEDQTFKYQLLLHYSCLKWVSCTAVFSAPSYRKSKYNRNVLWRILLLRVCVCVCVCTQSCPNLCNPMDCNPPGSSVHGIFQAQVLETGSWLSFPTPRNLPTQGFNSFLWGWKGLKDITHINKCAVCVCYYFIVSKMCY